MRRKKLFLIIPVLILLLAALPFTGCEKNSTGNGNDGDPPANTLIGTWNLISVFMEINGTVTEVPAAFTGMAITIIMETDGSFTITATENGVEETLTGTYTSTDSTITITYDDTSVEEMDYRFEGVNVLLDITIPLDLDGDGVEEDTDVTMKFARV